MSASNVNEVSVKEVNPNGDTDHYPHSMVYSGLNIERGASWEKLEATKKLDETDKPLLLAVTCEHASDLLPEGYEWTEKDSKVRKMHWAIDIGARDLTAEFVSKIKGGKAIIGAWSRLLIDMNRPLDDSTLCRTVADGQEIGINSPSKLSPEEKEKRILQLWKPYHANVSQMVHDITQSAQEWMGKHQVDSLPGCILSIHSFTPHYETQPKRDVEIGVLFDVPERDLAVRLHKKLVAKTKFNVRLNEPYSSMEGIGGHRAMLKSNKEQRKEGLGPKIDWLCIEVESRQDLLVDSEWRSILCDALVEFWKEEGFINN